jgi:hypothetical protein
MVVKGFRKLTRTTLVLLTQLPCKGGNIFAAVAGGYMNVGGTLPGRVWIGCAE